METKDSDFIRLQQALAGRYSLERELGRGGMGVVYLAREVSLDRPVALKLLPPGLVAQPSARERFMREARTAAKLSHPNIVPIHAVDELEDFVFFAMAYIEGETLGERIRTRGPRPPSEVARILREVAWALGYAHAQGVIHRDVKPDNILLESATGRALVADFGIANVGEAGDEGERSVSGTAEFMSPEQARGEPVSPASDRYSLGVVGFYAASGRLPFEGSTAAVILAKHIGEAAPPLSSAAPGVPGRLARAIDRCLAKEPADRFVSDEEMAEALGQATELRRELPVPLRVFVKRSRRFGIGGTVLYLWVLAMASSLIGRAAPAGLEAIAGFGTFIGGLTLLPASIAIGRVRRLLRSGYGPDELVAAFKAESDRTREEGAFEFGHGPSLYEKIVRTISAGSLGIAVLSGIGLAVLPPGVDAATLGATLGLSLTVGLGAGTLAVVRLQTRRDINSQLRTWLWDSRLGRWVFRLAGIGLRRLPEAGSATYRPTEYAIGMAADRLFDDLPRAMRRELADLPEIVRKLEADAQRMRGRLEELGAILPQIRDERRPSLAPGAAPLAERSSRVLEERQKLEHELLAAQDATQQRLADAVAALETIRLSLLRMHAGTGSVAGLTGDLAAARTVADDIERLLEAQYEVERLLRETE